MNAAGTPAPEPPRVRRRRHRSARTAGLAVCLLAVAAAAFTLRRAEADTGAAGVDPRQAAVHAVLLRLRSPWAERNIATLVPKTLSLADCRPVLEHILADPEHPWFRQAVLLSMHLGFADLVVGLGTNLPAVRDEDSRALVVTSVERFEPWSRDELTKLLGAESTKVTVAALRAAGQRPEPPVDLIAESLGSHEPEIRAAALAALPASIPPAVGERIVAATRELDASVANESILALALCAPSSSIDEFLYKRLAAEAFNRNAVLDALGRRGGPLLRPERILEVAADVGQPVGTRARALLCLERTATTSGLERLEAMWQRHPVLDYFAARSLLQAARPAGLQLLLDVVRADDDPDREDEDVAMVAEARMGARLLLAQLAGTSATADPATWEAWVQQRPVITAVTLPPSVVQLGP